jgi:hypothetical protein
LVVLGLMTSSNWSPARRRKKVILVKGQQIRDGYGDGGIGSEPLAAPANKQDSHVSRSGVLYEGDGVAAAA